MNVSGLCVHFVHKRSIHPGAKPLVLTHGWPGSFFEFHKVIGPLVDPVAHGGRASQAFHVVCPSIPGYGFSEAPKKRGFNSDEAAKVVHALMLELGYPEYYAQGGDWGSAITTALGTFFPE